MLEFVGFSCLLCVMLFDVVCFNCWWCFVIDACFGF